MEKSMLCKSYLVKGPLLSICSVSAYFKVNLDTFDKTGDNGMGRP